MIALPLHHQCSVFTRASHVCWYHVQHHAAIILIRWTTVWVPWLIYCRSKAIVVATGSSSDISNAAATHSGSTYVSTQDCRNLLRLGTLPCAYKDLEASPLRPYHFLPWRFLPFAAEHLSQWKTSPLAVQKFSIHSRYNVY